MYIYTTYCCSTGFGLLRELDSEHHVSTLLVLCLLRVVGFRVSLFISSCARCEKHSLGRDTVGVETCRAVLMWRESSRRSGGWYSSMWVCKKAFRPRGQVIHTMSLRMYILRSMKIHEIGLGSNHCHRYLLRSLCSTTSPNLLVRPLRYSLSLIFTLLVPPLCCSLSLIATGRCSRPCGYAGRTGGHLVFTLLSGEEQ